MMWQSAVIVIVLALWTLSYVKRQWQAYSLLNKHAGQARDVLWQAERIVSEAAARMGEK